MNTQTSGKFGILMRRMVSLPGPINGEITALREGWQSGPQTQTETTTQRLSALVPKASICGRMNELQNDDDVLLGDALRAHIAATAFPCVGAKAALGRNSLKIHVARDIRSAWNDVAIHKELLEFAGRYTVNPVLFQSFAVIFEQPRDLSEADFETVMWERIQSLTDKDCWLGQAADARVSVDPTDPHFSLSFGGEAFFVVGLHPFASRPARRFRYPTLIFNLHDQFEMLRQQRRYEKLRHSILARDEILAGSLNPMLARHGFESEAKQYSGRVVEPGWSPPYRRGETEGGDIL